MSTFDMVGMLQGAGVGTTVKGVFVHEHLWEDEQVKLQ